ncbi:MAG: hypothetical protein MRK00_13270 [Nitrosomonas sp.]|nr:hypothetical protein [Nitrosomonas sp.]
MLLQRSIICLFACWLFFAANHGYSRQYHYDSGCDCYVPDQSVPDTGTDTTPKNPKPNPFILKGTGADSATTKRDISEPVEVVHRQPDGQYETRRFRYSTPKNFKNRTHQSINLWFVFHGGGGNALTMHKFFDEVPHAAPTLIVYPEALQVNEDNILDLSENSDTKWRMARLPGSASDPNAYRDIAFIEWMRSKLLKHNPQLSAAHVYATGFSSGAGMTWMLLCYRSALFQGFAMYSQQLGVERRDGGCGDGKLPHANDSRTGYEKLTGTLPDQYGHRVSTEPGTPAQNAATKTVFYAHGTADKNLIRTGNSGCWQRGECDISEDPLFSMDPGGSLETRDDISTVNWLIARHQLSSKPNSSVFLPDSNLNDGKKVIQRSYYAEQEGRITRHQGAPISWLERIGAEHNVPSVERGDDYDQSVYTQRFFEIHADMLQ